MDKQTDSLIKLSVVCQKLEISVEKIDTFFCPCIATQYKITMYGTRYVVNTQALKTRLHLAGFKLKCGLAILVIRKCYSCHALMDRM